MTGVSATGALLDELTVVLGGPCRFDLEVLRFGLGLRESLRVLDCAHSDAHLVSKVAAQRPDVALVCCEDPRWGGLGACTSIKLLDVPTRVVVVASSEHDHASLMAAVKAGADGFVTASEGLDDVVGVLRRVAAGESSIPPAMLGALLRGLIEFRREDDEVVERYAGLGRREREVLAELVAGLDHQAIAAKLHLSPHTARTHTQNIFAKLGVHSRLEAAQLVFDHDLLVRFPLEADPGTPS